MEIECKKGLYMQNGFEKVFGIFLKMNQKKYYDIVL